MKNKLIALLLFVSFYSLSGQTEAEKVKIPLNDYMIGTSYNYPEQIERAFIDSAWLYLSNRYGSSWITGRKEYAALFEKRTRGEFNGLNRRILSTTIYQEVANA
ncbi:MAG: nuclear transport factor 2 family protein, partial [Bacteroidota bacterium]